MSQEDLDTVMMEDFGPDIDLLDELLLDPTIDWCKLEPSLSLNFEPPMSPHSPLGPEPPMQPMMGHPVSPESLPMSPPPTLVHLSQHSPIPAPVTPQPQPQVVPLTQNSVNVMSPLNVMGHSPGPNKVNVVTSNGTLSLQDVMTTSTPVSLSQQVQFTSGQFTSFVPITQAMFGGNTVLLPQLQLAVVGNSAAQISKRGNKLPVKRLEKEGGSRGRKKEPTSRRSSHNAIERRYRSSINDKILELKNLVCAPSDPNEKVHKAAILRSSIDTIRYLQNTNGRLDKENRDLKKSMSQCLTCRNDMTLRGILSGSPATPPPTESEATDSSNPPSPNEDVKPGAGLISKSPLLLFSFVAGLFLINPITHHSLPPMPNSVNEHPHSRVERSVDDPLSDQPGIDYYSLWFPRVITILINLVIFIIVYSMTGRIFDRKAKYSTEKLKVLKNKSWAKGNTNEAKAELRKILEEFDNFPKNWFSRQIRTVVNLAILPFQLRRKSANVKYVEINEEISTLYLEYGKRAGNGIFPFLRAINFSPINKQVLIRSLILAKSKFLLRYVLLWTDFSGHATFSTPQGLDFLKSWISRGVGAGGADFALQGAVGGDEAAQMISKFREDSLLAGINQLFYFGSGIDLFRIVLKSCGKNDKMAQFWTTVMWSQAEWIRGGGRGETLKRLYRLNDELWSQLKHKEAEPSALLKAVRKTHMCKRALMLNQVPSREMLDSASAYLRDSINTSTDKPKRAIQLIWCMTAEWILECRLELWEETKEICGFSKDLDTLRSLTHYVPASLPSLYLYEATQRLMNYAAPGRTQQLLDASLRQVRTNQRVLICNNNDAEGPLTPSEDPLLPPANCMGKKSKELNLVREKRKAFALYLKCKYLPNQVITCPGEKAGMLKEAMKALEKIGEKKKIKECLEMIRTVAGQNITLN